MKKDPKEAISPAQMQLLFSARPQYDYELKHSPYTKPKVFDALINKGLIKVVRQFTDREHTRNPVTVKKYGLTPQGIELYERLKKEPLSDSEKSVLLASIGKEGYETWLNIPPHIKPETLQFLHAKNLISGSTKATDSLTDNFYSLTDEGLTQRERLRKQKSTPANLPNISTYYEYVYFKSKHDLTLDKWNEIRREIILRLRRKLYKEFPEQSNVVAPITDPNDYLAEKEFHAGKERPYQELNWAIFNTLYLELYRLGRDLADKTFIKTENQSFWLPRLFLYLSNRPVWLGVSGFSEFTRTDSIIFFGNPNLLIWTTNYFDDGSIDTLPQTEAVGASLEQMQSYELRRIFPPTLAGLALLVDHFIEVMLLQYQGENLQKLLDRYKQLAAHPAKRLRAINYVFESHIAGAFGRERLRLPVIMGEDQKKTYVASQAAIPLLMARLQEIAQGR